jgi:hypothetical protein
MTEISPEVFLRWFNRFAPGGKKETASRTRMAPSEAVRTPQFVCNMLLGRCGTNFQIEQQVAASVQSGELFDRSG